MRAEGDSSPAAPAAEAKPNPLKVDPSKVPPLQWTKDTESLRDVFAFSSPVPEVGG